MRNGPNSVGTPTFRCRDCRRRFVAAPRKRPVAGELKRLVRRLLAERLALRAIARATGLSRSWPRAFVNKLYDEGTPHEPGRLKKARPLVIDADELWGFVSKKSEAWWVWAALDAGTRQVVAIILGDRSAFAARWLWDALPEDYRERAEVRTNFPARYAAAVPAGRHRPGGTAHVERF